MFVISSVSPVFFVRDTLTPPVLLVATPQRALPDLRDLLLVGNDIYKELDAQARRITVLKAVPQLTKIDGKLVTPIEREAAGAS